MGTESESDTLNDLGIVIQSGSNSNPSRLLWDPEKKKEIPEYCIHLFVYNTVCVCIIVFFLFILIFQRQWTMQNISFFFAVKRIFKQKF